LLGLGHFFVLGGGLSFHLLHISSGSSSLSCFEMLHGLVSLSLDLDLEVSSLVMLNFQELRFKMALLGFMGSDRFSFLGFLLGNCSHSFGMGLSSFEMLDSLFSISGQLSKLGGVLILLSLNLLLLESDLEGSGSLDLVHFFPSSRF